MCTAIKYKNIHGRNLDLEYTLDSKVVICPRNYKFNYRHISNDDDMNYAIIGMALVKDNYPLYFEAMNENGLFMGGLNFHGYAKFFEVKNDKNIKNISSFEFIPYVLRRCKNIKEARELIKNINITSTAFSDKLQPSPLHWQLSDKDNAIVVESTEKGLNIYDNPYGVLTNNPEFMYHYENFKNYLPVSRNSLESIKYPNGLEIKPISNGAWTQGLPGSLSSQDRFIKAAFTLFNSFSNDDEISKVTQFFHILKSVEQSNGQVIVTEDQLYEITVYSSAISADTLTYYYTTYNNSQINSISMKSKEVNLDSNNLYIYDLNMNQNINKQN